MCMTDQEEPARYRHDVRDDFDNLGRFHDLEKERDDSGARVLRGEEVALSMRDVKIDLDDGRVYATVRVETPCFHAETLAREIRSFGLGFEVVSHHDSSEGLLVQCMEGYL